MVIKKKWIVYGLLALSSYTYATDLNFSIIGNLQAEYQKDTGTNGDIKEFEFAWQSPLTANFQTNIFYAVHSEDGGYDAHIEEAYFNILNLPETTFGIKNNLGIGGKIGKKFLPLGKVNTQHPEQWKTVSKPMAFEHIIGHESLSGTGGQLEYLLPLPFFTQIELGTWKVDAPEEDSKSFENIYYTTRIWSSVPLSDEQELEIGLSNLSPKDKTTQTLSGIDITYKNFLGSSRKIELRTEYLKGYNQNDSPDSEGGYVLSNYQINALWESGLRYDWMKENNDTQTQLVIMLTHNHSEFSKTRFECLMNENSSPTFVIQYLFGVGPHAHTIQ